MFTPLPHRRFHLPVLEMGGLAIACAQAGQFMQELGIDPAEAENG